MWHVEAGGIRALPPEVEYSNKRLIFPTERRRPGLRLRASLPYLALARRLLWVDARVFLHAKVSQSSQKGTYI